jgi:hypothetical protein
MPRWKVNYKEGDWIALPVVDGGGWGLGLVARCKAPAILGYFFGPRRSEPPTMADTVGLTHRDALVIGLVGDLGLLKGEWRVIGKQPSWRREDWPIPLFTNEDGPRLYLCTYDEDDPAELLRREPTTPEQAQRIGAIPYVSHGYLALSIRLDMKLAEREAQSAA